MSRSPMRYRIKNLMPFIFLHQRNISLTLLENHRDVTEARPRGVFTWEITMKTKTPHLEGRRLAWDFDLNTGSITLTGKLR